MGVGTGVVVGGMTEVVMGKEKVWEALAPVTDCDMVVDSVNVLDSETVTLIVWEREVVRVVVRLSDPDTDMEVVVDSEMVPDADIEVDSEMEVDRDTVAEVETDSDTLVELDTETDVD